MARQVNVSGGFGKGGEGEDLFQSLDITIDWECEEERGSPKK